jgi:hypothetical protein
MNIELLLEIVGQALGIIATVLTFVSYQVNSKRGIIIVLTAATVCVCLSYFMLGAIPGAVLNIVCIVRNIFFYFIKPNTRLYFAVSVLMTATMCTAGILSWENISSLLIVTALTVNTVFLAIGRPHWLRCSILFTSTLVLCYNIIVFSIGGMANEIVAISSSVVGIIRFGRSVAEKSDKRERESVSTSA